MGRNQISDTLIDIGRDQTTNLQTDSLTNDNSKNKSWHLNLSNEYLAQQNLELAKQHLYQALRIDPNYAEGYNNLGRLFYKQGLFNDAIFYFEKALRLKQNYFEAHYNLAHSFSQLNQFERAKTHYIEVLKINDYHAIAHLNLGLIYYEAREHDKASTHLKRTLEIDPKQFNLYSYLYLAESLLALGNLTEAKAIYEKALKIYSNSHELHHNYAILCLKEDQKKQALQHFRDALGLNPNNETAKHMVQALSENPTIHTTSPTYVKDLFNQYADYYNQHVQEKLNYRLPFYLRNAFGNALKEKLSTGRVLDLGCGTGLCGIYFRDLAIDLIGVDISENMLEKAKQLQGYEALINQDIETYLEKNTKPFDLIIAADVLVYFGELETLFFKVKKNLNSNGHFIFSIENLDNNKLNLNKNFVLQSSGRFAHLSNYIQELAHKFNFKIILEENLILRMNQDEPVLGCLFILK